MHKCLYLVCPTDCLEPIIDNTFKQEHYFYTSLGNAFSANTETLKHIKSVVKKYDIRKICFVLSFDNQIIKDALSDQDFSDITGLHKFYSEITGQKKHSKTLGQITNRQFLVLSYYLNKKIIALQLALDNGINHAIKIDGKIYNRKNNTFKAIYSHLVCLKKHQLN